MRIAKSVGVRAFLLVLVSLLSACAVMSSEDQAVPENRPLVIRLPSLDMSELRKVSDYVAHFQELTPEAARQESARIQADAAADPLLFKRVCAGLALAMVGDGRGEYEQAMSLLGDTLKEVDERDPKLGAWLRQTRDLLARQAAMADRERRLLSERSDILRQKETLAKDLEAQAKELGERKAQAARLEQEVSSLKAQLDELKSIESSILQRNIKEEAAKP
jgi:hypothetical protein